MKIIQLQASNIKKLKAVELAFDENKNLVLITGKNAQGKSSILDSIWWALGGNKNIQEKPIREGEEKAEIIVDIEGKNKDGEKLQYIVTRTFTEKGTYLKVSNPDGSSYSNPQAFLDYVVGNLSFDPLEFSRLDGKKQIEELKTILKLDFTELDEKKKQLTEDRLFIGREKKSLKTYSEEEIAKAKETSQKPEVSVSEISQKLGVAMQTRDKFNYNQNKIKQNEENIKALEESIKKLKDENAELSKQENTTENIEELQKSINESDSINSEIRNAKKILEDFNVLNEKENKYKELTDQIREIDDNKAKQLSEAELPIEGLSWDDGEVLFKGIPFSQISSAEQLRVSMAIAMASNPKLKLIIIKDGSLLDSENMKIVEEMAKDKDFTVLVEKVDDTGKIGIYIEEGEIKSIN